MILRPESETQRDGFLSSRAEGHAAGIGLFFGVASALTTPWLAIPFALVMVGLLGRRSPHLRDAAKEAGYACGFFLCGYVFTVALPYL